ncbi:unnamed protein product [Cyclocybe aegerita]|uniref:C2H2-type domain-containing protein n=1 Tax=Cyclocybe aegerita TaxID=1973307 RepID=A0A8S0XJL0_CYCAE|nr:unnamed protein product [Cyclocybe aegerita]
MSHGRPNGYPIIPERYQVNDEALHEYDRQREIHECEALIQQAQLRKQQLLGLTSSSQRPPNPMVEMEPSAGRTQEVPSGGAQTGQRQFSPYGFPASNMHSLPQAAHPSTVQPYHYAATYPYGEVWSVDQQYFGNQPGIANGAYVDPRRSQMVHIHNGHQGVGGQQQAIQMPPASPAHLSTQHASTSSLPVGVTAGRTVNQQPVHKVHPPMPRQLHASGSTQATSSTMRLGQANLPPYQPYNHFQSSGPVVTVSTSVGSGRADKGNTNTTKQDVVAFNSATPSLPPPSAAKVSAQAQIPTPPLASVPKSSSTAKQVGGAFKNNSTSSQSSAVPSPTVDYVLNCMAKVRNWAKTAPPNSLSEISESKQWRVYKDDQSMVRIVVDTKNGTEVHSTDKFFHELLAKARLMDQYGSQVQPQQTLLQTPRVPSGPQPAQVLAAVKASTEPLSAQRLVQVTLPASAPAGRPVRHQAPAQVPAAAVITIPTTPAVRPSSPMKDVPKTLVGNNWRSPRDANLKHLARDILLALKRPAEPDERPAKRQAVESMVLAQEGAGGLDTAVPVTVPVERPAIVSAVSASTTTTVPAPAVSGAPVSETPHMQAVGSVPAATVTTTHPTSQSAAATVTQAVNAAYAANDQTQLPSSFKGSAAIPNTAMRLVPGQASTSAVEPLPLPPSRNPTSASTAATSKSTTAPRQQATDKQPTATIQPQTTVPAPSSLSTPYGTPTRPFLSGSFQTQPPVTEPTPSPAVGTMPAPAPSYNYFHSGATPYHMLSTMSAQPMFQRSQAVFSISSAPSASKPPPKVDLSTLKKNPASTPGSSKTKVPSTHTSSSTNAPKVANLVDAIESRTSGKALPRKTNLANSSSLKSVASASRVTPLQAASSAVIDLTSPEPGPAALQKKEPLFLPSPSPEPRMSSRRDSVSSIEEIESLALPPGATKARHQKTKARRKIPYILVPPPPDYLVALREYERKKAERRVAPSGSEIVIRRRTTTNATASASTSASADQSRSGSSSRAGVEDQWNYYPLESRPDSESSADPAEREAIQLACTRVQEMSCRWNGCDVVLNSVKSLIRHLNEQHKPPRAQLNYFTCLWTQCGRRCDYRDKHFEKHAMSPLRCAYQDCNESYRTGGQLLKHFKAKHEKDKLRPSAKPALPTLKPVGALPGSLPAFLIVTGPVKSWPISQQRHALLGPWVLRNIVESDQEKPRQRTRKTARSTGAPAIEPSNDYEFLTARTTRYSSLLSQPVDMHLGDLDSARISKMIDDGLTFWPGKQEGSSGMKKPQQPLSPTRPGLGSGEDEGDGKPSYESEAVRAGFSSDEDAVENMLTELSFVDRA